MRLRLYLKCAEIWMRKCLDPATLVRMKVETDHSEDTTVSIMAAYIGPWAV